MNFFSYSKRYVKITCFESPIKRTGEIRIACFIFIMEEIPTNGQIDSLLQRSYPWNKINIIPLNTMHVFFNLIITQQLGSSFENILVPNNIIRLDYDLIDLGSTLFKWTEYFFLCVNRISIILWKKPQYF